MSELNLVADAEANSATVFDTVAALIGSNFNCNDSSDAPDIGGSIPAELRAERRWVVARVPSKVPLCAFDPRRNADSTDSTTWTDFKTAQGAVERDPTLHLGFALGGGFVGVDLDKCRNAETGVVETWADAIVHRLASYTEISVSRTGIHIICRGALPVKGRRTHGIEMYAENRYFVMTGHGGAEAVAERTTELAALFAEVFGDVLPDAPAAALPETEPAGEPDLNDDELLDKIRASVQGARFTRLWNGDTSHKESASEADAALCAMLAWWTRKDASRMDRLFRRSGLYRAKWDRKDYRERTITGAIARVDGGYDPTAANTEPAASTRKAPKSDSAALVKLVMTRADAELFHSPDNLPYATIGHKTMKVLDNDFKQWLSREFYIATQRVPSGSALGDAINTLMGVAKNDGPERHVFTRIADMGHAVYVDLGTSGVVEVTATGWHVVPCADVRFVRFPGFLPLPVPVPNTDNLDSLFGAFLNVHDEHDLRLIVAWAVAALRGVKPFPILSVNGEQGSAKSSACRFLRRLIDPNGADTRLPPRDLRDLMIAAHNSYIIAWDNLTKIDETLANGLCCLSTGAGSATRALTTNTDEILINVARPILLNGINDVVKRADLLDRTLQVTLDPIPDDARKTEAEVRAAFDSVQARILGRLLDAVACALKNERTTRPPRLPRMAELAVTMMAAEPALGWAPGSFLAMYADARRNAVETLFEGDVLAAAIQRLDLPWSGTADELRRRIVTLVPPTDAEQLPKTAKSMASKVRERASGLRQIGIDVRFEQRRHRMVTIQRVTAAAPDAATDTPSNTGRAVDQSA